MCGGKRELGFKDHVNLFIIQVYLDNKTFKIMMAQERESSENVKPNLLYHHTIVSVS